MKRCGQRCAGDVASRCQGCHTLRLRRSESDGASSDGRARTERARVGPAAVCVALLRAGKEAEGRQLLDYFSLLQREHQNILDFKTAIVLNPNDADAFYRLGVIYARIGRYRAGLQAYRAALEIAPDHIDALNNLGNIHLRQRRLMDAINAYEKVLALAPQYARAHHNLGNAYVLLNDAPRAVAAFERAVGADSSYAAPRQMLAQLYRRAGRLQEADAQQTAYEYLSDSGVRP